MLSESTSKTVFENWWRKIKSLSLLQSVRKYMPSANYSLISSAFKVYIDFRLQKYAAAQEYFISSDFLSSLCKIIPGTQGTI